MQYVPVCLAPSSPLPLLALSFPHPSLINQFTHLPHFSAHPTNLDTP
jgi:hypothetical protein